MKQKGEESEERGWGFLLKLLMAELSFKADRLPDQRLLWEEDTATASPCKWGSGCMRERQSLVYIPTRYFLFLMRGVTAANQNIAFRDKCLHLCFCKTVTVLPDEEAPW